MDTRIAIAGVAGRMGRTLVKCAHAAEDLVVVGGTERPGSGELGGDIGRLAGLDPVGVSIDLSAEKAAHSADVWVDFTSPLSTLEALDALKSTTVRAAIIGTTGFNDEEDKQLLRHAERVAIVRAGNFSLGVNLLTALVQQAAERLDESWDIEILETHHRMKVDAPSGTALMLGEAAAYGRGAPLADLRTPPYDGITGERNPGDIGFSVRRSGGVIGDHEATFTSMNEILSLRHTAMNRDIFADGALHAARWAVKQSPGFYSMRNVLGL